MKKTTNIADSLQWQAMARSGSSWILLHAIQGTSIFHNPVASSAFHVDHHPGTFIFDAGMVTTIATVGWSYSILYALVHNPQSIW